VLGVDAHGANPLAAAWQAARTPAAWGAGAMLFAVFAAAVIRVGKRISPLLPGVLIAVSVAIAASVLLGFDGPTVGALPDSLPSLTLNLPWYRLPALLVPSLVIALIGFAEPSAIARQYAAADRQRWDPNREMVGQGLANLAAGFGGGYAVGGSFSRTALNRLAGARTRLSGAVTGLVALAFLPAADLLATLPIAVLGAIVIVAVVPLLALGPLREFWAYSRPQALVAVATFAITIALAPRVDRAVLVGIGLAVAVHLWRELHVRVPNWTDGVVLHLRPRGVLYFASTPPIEETFIDLLAAHPEAERLVLHCDGLGRIDLTGALALRAVLLDARAAGMRVEVVDIPPHAQRIVSRVLADAIPVAPDDPRPGPPPPLPSDPA
jgi:SulP family sulfate permease